MQGRCVSYCHSNSDSQIGKCTLRMSRHYPSKHDYFLRTISPIVSTCGLLTPAIDNLLTISIKVNISHDLSVSLANGSDTKMGIIRYYFINWMIEVMKNCKSNNRLLIIPIFYWICIFEFFSYYSRDHLSIGSQRI